MDFSRAPYGPKPVRWPTTYFREAFGQKALDACWHDLPIQMTREARVALAHNGGKMAVKLDKLPHGQLINDGEIQLAVSTTTALYLCLKERVSGLVT